MSRTLRVGVLCDGPVFQRWQAEALSAVLAVEGVQPVVLVMNDAKPAAPSSPWKDPLHYPWRIALFLRYRRSLKPNAYEPVDLSAALATVPRVPCRTIRKGPEHRFEQKDLDAIAAHEPDVLLRFGFNILRGPILELPRYGVWSYHHGDEEQYRGQPPLFWELMDGKTTAAAVLQRLTDKLDAGVILRKCWFKLTARSLEEALDHVLLGSTHLMARVCAELIAGIEQAAEGEPSATKAPIRKYPGNLDYLRFRRKLDQKSTARSAGFKEWNIGVLYQPIASLLGDRPSLNVRWLPSPSSGQGRATPFGYAAEEQLNVLYEKNDRRTGKSEISRLRPKRDNVLKRSRTMLKSEAHLTYPFVIEQDGRTHVLIGPGTSGGVDLFAINPANDGLEPVGTLLNEPLCAPTLFTYNGKWWLMGTRAPHEHSALHIYHASRFEGPYRPHALQPVKQDVRSARPAGTPFVHEGTLYRPALDASSTARVCLMKVTRLDEYGFEEEIVRTIGPLKGSAWSEGIGTLSAVGEITLISGVRTVQLDSEGARKKKRSPDRSTLRTRERRSRDEDDDDEEDER